MGGKIPHIYSALVSPFCFFLSLSQQWQRLSLQSPLSLMKSILSMERHQQQDPMNMIMSPWPLPMEIVMITTPAAAAARARTRTRTRLNMFQDPLTVKGCQPFLLRKSKGSFVWPTWLEGRSLVLPIFVSPFCFHFSFFPSKMCWLISGKLDVF